MNDEQSKRLADAADALVQAADALEEARAAAADSRFDSEQERDRQAASQQLVAKVDGAAKRIEEAIRKGTTAAGAAGRSGGYQLYRQGSGSVRKGRTLGRTIADQDGTSAKRTRADEALQQLDEALEAAAGLVFPA